MVNRKKISGNCDVPEVKGGRNPEVSRNQSVQTDQQITTC